MGGRIGAVLAGVLVATGAMAAEDAPCPHPYFPIAEGLELTYRAGKSEVQIRFSDVKKDGANLNGTLHMEHKGRSGTTEAKCSGDGIQTQLGGIEGAALSMSGMDVKVVSSEGIAMPPPAALIDGATWSNTMAIELRPPEGSKLAFGVIRTTFRKDATVERREKIEVAGKTWDALRVKNKITAMAGTSGERTIESIMWLAPEVGILKIQTGNSVDFELLDVKHADKAKPEAKSKAGVGGAGKSGAN